MATHKRVQELWNKDSSKRERVEFIAEQVSRFGWQNDWVKWLTGKVGNDDSTKTIRRPTA